MTQTHACFKSELLSQRGGRLDDLQGQLQQGLQKAGLGEDASKSAGKYTQAQIEEQMRLMGNAVTGEKANTTTVLTNTEAIVQNIYTDPSMPKTVQGSVVVEVPGQANAELQNWIITNTTQGAGYIPGQSPYTVSNTGLNAPRTTNTPGTAPVTAACANNDLACKSGVGAQQTSIPQMTQAAREAIADGAATTSRQAGVVGAAATAATAAASPQVKPITGAVAVGATVIGVAADVVEQVVRPDTGQTVVNSIGTAANEVANKVLPIAAPVVNEIIERAKQTDKANEVRDSSNQFIERVFK